MKIQSIILTFISLLNFSNVSLVNAQESNIDDSQRAYLGKDQPNFSLPDINGKLWTNQSWQGKALVVNFWASWCTPCRREIPMFNRLQKEYQPDGVQFIGIAIDNKHAVETFKAKIPIDYPVLIGNLDAGKLSRQFGNLQEVLPYTVFVNKHGKIEIITAGGLDEETTRRSIEKLL